SEGAHTLASICLSLLLLDWTKRAAADRASRVSLGNLVIVGLVAVAVASILEAAPEVVIGVLCGTCIAVQIASPWTPGFARAGRSGDVSPVAPGRDAPLPEFRPDPAP